VTAPDSDAIC